MVWNPESIAFVWNPESRRLVSGIQMLGSGIQDLRGFSYMGRSWMSGKSKKDEVVGRAFFLFPRFQLRPGRVKVALLAG